MFTVLLFFRWICRRERDLPVLFLAILTPPPEETFSMNLTPNELLSRIWQILEINERGFLGSTVLKNLPANTEDQGVIPGSGKSPGEGNGKPLHSCLGNPMDRGAWWLKSMGSQRVRQGWVTEHTQNNYCEEINSLRD